MSKVECIISSIIVLVGNALIITGYSFFDELRVLIAIGIGLISGQLIGVIYALKKENKDE